MRIEHIFREYDIRGIFGEDLTHEVVFGIGRELGKYIKQSHLPHCIHIGYDARIHSPTLFEWLTEGFLSENIEVYELGLIPTPVAYFATFNVIDSITCPNSVMITGSHNPPQYNGFKITINRAPFYGEQIRTLGANLAKNFPQLSHKSQDTQKIQKLSAKQAYIDFLTQHFEHLRDFPYPIVYDCGNGVAGVALAQILKNLNISYTPLFFEPDGNFPNHHPDPSEEKISKI